MRDYISMRTGDVLAIHTYTHTQRERKEKETGIYRRGGVGWSHAIEPNRGRLPLTSV